MCAVPAAVSPSAPADDPVAPAPRPRHLPALDGLRGLAILVVLIHNASGLDAAGSLPEKLWLFVVGAGWIGVQLFFVLSGFLITGILLDNRDKPRALRTFYLRRSFRIFPLYYAFLIGRFLILPLFVPSLAVPGGEQLWFWLYLSNWALVVTGTSVGGMGHFWSLAVEEQFYLLWPALALKLRVRTFAWVCVALAAGSFLSRIGMRLFHVPDVWMYASTFARVDGLALGALVAIAVRSERGRAMLARVKLPAGVVAGLGLMAVIGSTHGLDRYEWLVQSLGYSMLAILFALVVAAAATPSTTGWQRAMSGRALARIGTYSYAIYVVHLPLKLVLLWLLPASVAAWSARAPLAYDVGFVIAVGVASFVVAAITFVAIERPFLRLKERVAPGR
jgi:peptidoglycan/LPS O-acetylase OafA/YrhL